jgi:hypothetical protein
MGQIRNGGRPLYEYSSKIHDNRCYNHSTTTTTKSTNRKKMSSTLMYSSYMVEYLVKLGRQMYNYFYHWG